MMLILRIYHTSVYKHNRLYNVQSGLASSAEPVFSMPHSGMKAPMVLNNGSVGEWRR